jgi:hypothetical protein
VSGKTATPYELFVGTVPDLSLVKVFGCKAYVKLEKVDHALTKLGPQSESGIFLGIEPNTKAYRVLIGTQIRVSRHVRFSEEKFKSAGTVDGLMLVEHEEYDPDSDVCEEDYDVIGQHRTASVPKDPFISDENREAQPAERSLVEEVIVENTESLAAGSPREIIGRNVLTFPLDWNWEEQTPFDFPDTQTDEPDNGEETEKSVNSDAEHSESPVREENDDDDDGDDLARSIYSRWRFVHEAHQNMCCLHDHLYG